MYKSQLQELAQKSHLNLPVYTFIQEGTPHAPRFKATVTFHGEEFHSPEKKHYSTLRHAEHAAVEVALNKLSQQQQQEEDPSHPSSSSKEILPKIILDEKGGSKNKLQELAQRAGIALPVYSATRHGEKSTPVFLATVEVASMVWEGEYAKNKKDAEKSAAAKALSVIEQHVHRSRDGSAPEPTMAISESQ